MAGELGFEPRLTESEYFVNTTFPMTYAAGVAAALRPVGLASPRPALYVIHGAVRWRMEALFKALFVSFLIQLPHDTALLILGGLFLVLALLWVAVRVKTGSWK